MDWTRKFNGSVSRVRSALQRDEVVLPGMYACVLHVWTYCVNIHVCVSAFMSVLLCLISVHLHAYILNCLLIA